jgi:group I intron endonuclease
MNTFMATCGIYRIINKINDKFYIGSSDNIERRFSRHLLDLKKNKHDNQHLQNAWNKYGKEASISIFAI